MSEIARYEAYTHYESGFATGGDSRPSPDGDFVLFTDHEAALAVERERAEKAKARIEKARRLLIELEQSSDSGVGLIPTPILEPRLNEIFATLSEYRDETEEEE